jgi:hypothetical protein
MDQTKEAAKTPMVYTCGGMLYFSSINIKIVILDVAPGTIFVDRKAP